MNDVHQQLLIEVKNYKMPPAAVQFLGRNPSLIISSVTASGKNTVANRIITTTNYRETVSHTTRSPRSGEADGLHYWFVDETRMLQLVRNRAFIEIKAIHGETIYGTSVEAYKLVLNDGYQPLLVIDVQGVEEISKVMPKLRPFFLLPPSYEDWMNRLHSRGVIKEEDKAERLNSARREIQTVLGNSAYILVVNDYVDRTAQEILLGKIDENAQRKNRQLAQNLYQQLTK